MSIIETAEQRLKELNGGEFQALAARYVGCKYHIASVHHSGRSFGTVEATIGTPDCFLQKPNGHFIYVECGKRQDRPGTLRKLREDVEHCLDYEKKHQDFGEIDAIICCYHYARLLPEDLSSIERKDEKGRVVLIGPEELAEACATKYPWLARDYLGLMIGTGAFLDAQAFIERNHNNRFTPDMDQHLVGRYKEFATVREAILENQAVLLFGPSGCGKTKLALEVCQSLSNERDVDFYIITPSRQGIFEDLRVFLSDDQPTYLLLDDASMVAGLSTIIDYVLGKTNIRLIVTCSSYAQHSVEIMLKQLKQYKGIPLEPLQSDDFNVVIRDEFGIRGASYRKGIASIVQGDLKLAFLYAQTRREKNDGTVTMRDVLEAIYMNKLDDMPEHEKKAIAIATILDLHGTKKNEQLNLLLGTFGLSWEEYMSSCRTLCERGLIGATPCFEAICLRDQSLGYYLLHRFMVVDSVLHLKDLWFVPGGHFLCHSVYGIIVTVFQDEETERQLQVQLKTLLANTEIDEEALLILRIWGPQLGMKGFLRLCSIVQRLESPQKDSVRYSPFDFSRYNYRAYMLEYPFESGELMALEPFLLWGKTSSAAIRLLFELLSRKRLSEADLMTLFWGVLRFAKLYPHQRAVALSETLDALESARLSDDGSTEAFFATLLARSIFDDAAPVLMPESIEVVPLGVSSNVLAVRRKCLEMLLRNYRDDWLGTRIRKVLLCYFGCSVRAARGTYELLSSSLFPLLRLESFEECEDVCRFIVFAADSDVTLIDRLPQHIGAGKRFAMRLFEYEDYGEREGLAALVHDSQGLSLENWKELLGLLKVENQRIDKPNRIDAFFSAVLSSSMLDSSVRELIVDSTIVSTVYLPTMMKMCAVRYFEKYGLTEARNRIISARPPFRSSLLYWLYLCSIESGQVPCIDELIDLLGTCGQVLSFATICDMERLLPGAFSPYLHSLANHVDVVLKRRQYYLPNTREQFIAAMSGECDTIENWGAVSQLACSLCADPEQSPTKQTVGLMIEKVPSFLTTFFVATVQKDSCQLPSDFWDGVFEAVGVCHVMETICSIENEIDVEESFEREKLRRLASNAAIEAVNLARGEELCDWLLEEIRRSHDESYSVIVAMVLVLPRSYHLPLALKLANEGVSCLRFERLAYQRPVEQIVSRDDAIGDSVWQLRYCKTIESNLLDNGLIEYLPSAHTAVELAKNELLDTLLDNARGHGKGIIISLNRELKD